MERLGFVEINKWWNFCESWGKEFEKERWNGKENSSGRKCLWFGQGVELGKISRIKEGWLEWFVPEIDLSWNSLLVYKYEKGCELKDHVDRDIFEDDVFIINLCKEKVGFRYSEKVNWLGNGELVKINGRIKHGVCKVNEVRYSLSFRSIK